MSNPSDKMAFLNAQSVSLYDPPRPATLLVCPHCLTPVQGYAFVTRDDVTIETYSCTLHGDIVPRRSAVSNPPHTPIPAYGPRTGTHPAAVWTPRENELRRMASKLARPVQPKMMREFV